VASVCERLRRRFGADTYFSDASANVLAAAVRRSEMGGRREREREREREKKKERPVVISISD